jgi:hypothetical protein
MIRHKSWCERGDSNPHPLRDQILSLARLPVPPLSLLVTPSCFSCLQSSRFPASFKFRVGVPEGVPVNPLDFAFARSHGAAWPACLCFHGADIRCELRSGVNEVSVTGDIIPVEYSPRLVARLLKALTAATSSSVRIYTCRRPTDGVVALSFGCGPWAALRYRLFASATSALPRTRPAHHVKTCEAHNQTRPSGANYPQPMEIGSGPKSLLERETGALSTRSP